MNNQIFLHFVFFVEKFQGTLIPGKYYSRQIGRLRTGHLGMINSEITFKNKMAKLTNTGIYLCEFCFALLVILFVKFTSRNDNPRSNSISQNILNRIMFRP